MSKQTGLLGLVVLVVLMAVFALPMLAQDDASSDSSRYPVDTIAVSGVGTAVGAPDIATMEIGVEIRNADVREAFTQSNATIDAVINALVTAGIARDDIRTSGVNMYYERPGFYDGSNPESSSYVINNVVRVVVRDTTIIGDVMSAAIESGANNIYGLTFGIEDRSALETEARAEAMENARARAAELAALAGAELGEVVIVAEGWTGGNPFDLMNFAESRMMGGGGMDSAAPIEPGQLSVQVQLQVTYRLNR